MKVKALLFPVFMLFAVSCKKTPQTSSQGAGGTYLTTSTGSSWNYHQIDSSGSNPVNSDYNVTSTSTDTVINGRSYHIFNTSAGRNQYLNISGNDYYQFDTLPAGIGSAVFERLYLKDNSPVGTQWGQSVTVTVPGIPFPVPVTLTNTISEKGISRTVNGNSYSDVIRVSSTISSSLIPGASLTSSINSYYAKKYGLIENTTIIHLDFTGIIANVNIETKIVSATLL
jgi:hypothetical protein